MRESISGRKRARAEGLSVQFQVADAEDRIVELFGSQAAQIRCERLHFNFRYRSAVLGAGVPAVGCNRAR